MGNDNCDCIYKALIDGAYDGLSGYRLIAEITKRCPEATAPLIAKATRLALSDADVTDPQVLGAVCGVAIAQARRAFAQAGRARDHEIAPLLSWLCHRTRLSPAAKQKGELHAQC